MALSLKESRACAETSGVRVRTFLGSKPANRFTYSVAWEDEADLREVQGWSATDELMALAEEGVKRGLR